METAQGKVTYEVLQGIHPVLLSLHSVHIPVKLKHMPESSEEFSDSATQVPVTDVPSHNAARPVR